MSNHPRLGPSAHNLSKEDTMKLSRVVTSVTMVLAVLLVEQVASAQPVWTDILNQPGTGSMASGTLWQIGPSPQPSQVLNTALPQINDRLSLAVPSLTGQGNQTGSFTCGFVGSPVTFIESNQGSGVKGVGFLGAFDAPFGGVPLTYTPNNNLFESVFFHEDPCYGGHGGTSREYGFFLAGSNSSVWVYWGTHENQSSVVQAQIQLPLNPNTEYFYEMFPTGNSSSCGFQVTILNTGFGVVYNNQFNVNSSNFGGTITVTDPGFCAAITSSFGDTGYVSANITAGPQVSGTLPPPSQLNTFMERVFVGK